MEPLSDILLSPEVGITLFIEILLFSLLFIAFLYTIVILKNWDRTSSNEYQYKLEKRSYLVTTIISLTFVIKMILLPFFTYTLDKLSLIVPGAMCGAGVIDANKYGEISLVLKLLIIILVLLWLSLNKEDQQAKNFPYFKKKMLFFIFIFTLISVEIVLEFLFFINISTIDPVLCCSSIYKSEIDLNPIPFNLSIIQLITLFYTLSFFMIISLYLKKRYLLAPLSLFYTYISYYAISYFFSTYIYELPTHKCPFCMLQLDYNYIGYFIFASLLMATFYTLNTSIFNFSKNSFKKAIIFYVVFNIFVSFYFVIYLIRNGVML